VYLSDHLRRKIQTTRIQQVSDEKNKFREHVDAHAMDIDVGALMIDMLLIYGSETSRKSNMFFERRKLHIHVPSKTKKNCIHVYRLHTSVQLLNVTAMLLCSTGRCHVSNGIPIFGETRISYHLADASCSTQQRRTATAEKHAGRRRRHRSLRPPRTHSLELSLVGQTGSGLS
jgi:hypothetical protein